MLPFNCGRLPRRLNTIPPNRLQRPVLRPRQSQLQMPVLQYTSAPTNNADSSSQTPDADCPRQKAPTPPALAPNETSHSPAATPDRSSPRLQILRRQTRRRMFIQTPAKLRNPLRPNRDPRRMRVAAKLLKQIRTRSQTVQKMIRLDASSRAVGHVAIDRQHHARAIQTFRNLRRRDSDHAAMPSLARDHRDVSSPSDLSTPRPRDR